MHLWKSIEKCSRSWGVTKKIDFFAYFSNFLNWVNFHLSNWFFWEIKLSLFSFFEQRGFLFLKMEVGSIFVLFSFINSKKLSMKKVFFTSIIFFSKMAMNIVEIHSARECSCFSFFLLECQNVFHCIFRNCTDIK